MFIPILTFVSWGVAGKFYGMGIIAQKKKKA